MLLVFVSAAFATAPGWVAEGVELEYSMDSDTVTFTVTERTSTEVKMTIDTGKEHQATENASLIYGQFWFDDSLLEDADEGDDIEEFEVIDEGTETFAGKQWDTVTLEAIITEAKTVRIYDRDSGLMLEQTVDVAGAPTVTLEKYTIPDMEAVAPPPPPPPEPTPPANDTTEPANETTEPPEPELYNDTEQPDDTTTDTTTVTDTTEDEEEAETEPQGKKKCIGGAILLMLAGLVLVKR
jgi:hypothetical protein